MLRDGYFSPEESERFKSVFDALTYHGDHYMLAGRLRLLRRLPRKSRPALWDPHAWTQKAILNVAGMGQFSSDRTIAQYAKTIWNTEPKARPAG
jgi:starch phosphorylase